MSNHSYEGSGSARREIQEGYQEHLESRQEDLELQKEQAEQEIMDLFGSDDSGFRERIDLMKAQAKRLKLSEGELRMAILKAFPMRLRPNKTDGFGPSFAEFTYYLSEFGIDTVQSKNRSLRPYLLRDVELLFCFSDVTSYATDKLHGDRGVKSFLQDIDITQEEKTHLIEQMVFGHLLKGRVASVKAMIKSFELPDTFIESPEVQEAIKEGLISCLVEGQSILTNKLLNFDPSKKEEWLHDPEILDAARRGIENEFVNGRLDLERVRDLTKLFDVKVNPQSYAAIYFDPSVPRAIREAIETYPSDQTPFSVEAQRARLTHALSPAEFQVLVEKNPDLRTSSQPISAACESLHDYLQTGMGENPEIAANMEKFVSLFGPETTMLFANRPDRLSRHDAFLSAHQLEAVMKNLGADILPTELPATFRKRFSQVLLQVAQDTSINEESLNSHQLFAEVMSKISTRSLEQVFVEIESLGIPALSTRVQKLQTGRFHPMDSWKGLREASDLIQLLDQRELLEALQSSKVPESVKTYVATLMAYPHISLGSVLKFLKEPELFLSAPAMFVNNQLQERLSPARLLDIEKIQLTPEDVRDALVDGTMDRLQVLPPHEELFAFDAQSNDIFSASALQGGFARAIGRQREGIKGEAMDAKQLFANLTKWAKEQGISAAQCIGWLKGQETLEWSQSQYEALSQILYAPKIGMTEPDRVQVRVRIGKKSDPHMIVAGNDTASCMPFGDGKTNVYAWNPNCAQLVVERLTSEGQWRTIAQSVLMVSIDTQRPTSEVVEALVQNQTLTDVLSAKVFASMPKIVCDNIEPTPNDISAGRAPMIVKAYEHFFHSYLSTYAASLGIDASEVIVGKESYQTNRPDWSFPKSKNTFVPLAPVSYMDSAGPECYRLNTGLPPGETHWTEVATVGASDVMPMAMLEAKAYKDNPQLIFGLYDRQHKIVAASIAREKEGDPAFSLLSRDKQGVPVGYMIAYVDRTTNVPEVFIDDLAVDRTNQFLSAHHAVRLIKTFLERYVNHFASSPDGFPPIFAQMRESTSYLLVTRHAKKFAAEFDLKIEIVEEGDTALGQETFKSVRIFLAKTDEQLKEQKLAVANRKVVETSKKDKWRWG